MSVFDEMGKYWAEMADQNQTERQIEFLKKSLKPEELVLDLACGSGRHLIELCKVGYNVVGLDISPKLLKIAKNKWGDSQLVRADMRFLPFKTYAFSAVVSMDQSFGYLPSEKDDLLSLLEVKKVLQQNGVFTIDLFNRGHVINQLRDKDELKWREYPSFFLVQKRTFDSTNDKISDQWTVYDWVEGEMRIFNHAARLYTLDGLKNLLKQAGFFIQAVFGDYELQSWTEEAHRLIIAAIATS